MTDGLPSPAQFEAARRACVSNAAARLHGEQLLALHACAESLLRVGPNAARVLAQVAERLAAGASYGDLDQEKNWDAEAREELVDCLVYTLVRMGQP